VTLKLAQTSVAKSRPSISVRGNFMIYNCFVFVVVVIIIMNNEVALNKMLRGSLQNDKM